MVKLSFRGQVLTGFATSIVLVLAVGLLSYRSINQFREDTNYVDHTEKVIKTSSTLQQLMVDAETGMRGYVATGNPAFLDPYSASVSQISVNLSKLKELIQDNPIEVRRVDSMSTLIHDQLGIIKANIDTRPVKGLDFMVQNHMLLNGKQNMDQIRGVVDRIYKTENDLLAKRRASSDESSTSATVVILTGTLVFFIIIVVMFFYIQGTFDRQRRIEEEIRVTNVQLEKVLSENEAKNWLLTGISYLNEKMQGQQNERELAGNVLGEVCAYTKALSGTFYLYNAKENYLELYASYAFHNPQQLKKIVALNEGWLGQAATDGKTSLVKGRVNDKLNLESSIISDDSLETIVVPFFFDKQLKGVMEIAFRGELPQHSQDFIMEIAGDVAVAVNTAQARTIMHELFEETQQQAEELSAQQEEMRVTNEELLNKTEMLQASEEELRVQQEELRSINSELEEKASLLEEKNQAIEEARNSIGGIWPV
jgi:CHASE3 domain sensor protein